MKSAQVLALAVMLLSACQNNSPPQAPAPSLTLIPNIASGQILATKCGACHGLDGASGKKDTPFLAGQQADYLAGALHTYANGTRKHEGMKAVAQALNERDIMSVAAYYAQLNTPWKGAAPPPASTLRHFSKTTIAAGQASSRPCDSCHGVDGNSMRAGVPSLAGLQPEYFAKALNSYFSGERTDPIMSVFQQSLSKQEIKTMGAYYASQPRAKTRFLSHGKAEPGKSISGVCNGCHGVDGNSINPAVPSLGGQNGPYLENVLLAYRNGKRKNSIMQASVASLQPKDLRDLAAYFSSQEPQLSGVASALVPDKFDPISDGARLAANCAGCHGDQGNSSIAGIPSLSCLHNDYLASAIKAYRDGTRNHATMKDVVLNLSDTDIAKLALYYATQEAAGKRVPGKGDASAGEKRAANCNTCHSSPASTSTPTLAGQDPAYLIAAVKAYASGTRIQPNMQNAVKDLHDNDLNNLAAYFSAQAPVKPVLDLPEAPEILSKKCDRCHGENGRSNEPTKPRLNGQVESYLIQALQSYKNGVRDNTMMHAMSDVLSDLEITAIAAYYARQP